MSSIDQLYTHVLTFVYAKSGKYLEICQSFTSNYSITICGINTALIQNLGETFIALKQ